METREAMDVIWAPWRMEYLEGDRMKDCIFCVAAADREDSRRHVLYRGQHAFIIMNRYPYTSGHLMVAPYRHLSQMEELDGEEMAELMALARKGVKALKKGYRPQGFNIGINIGAVAGAGIEAHIHLHVVPRWKGDTNFMPVLGSARVMPESLESTYKKLAEYINE